MDIAAGRYALADVVAHHSHGDPGHLCTACAFSAGCIATGQDEEAMRRVQCVVEHLGPYHVGDAIFRTHEPFRAIYAVRAGMVKTQVVDGDGHEQVLGFYLPGEAVGLNAIHPERYPCDAAALDTVYVCRFSFPTVRELAQQVPDLLMNLLRALSKEIGTSAMLAGDYSADERMAAFLLDLGERLAERRQSATQLHLAMPRSDIANYLRLAPETVSRVLARFREQGLIRVDGREIELTDVPRLRERARNVLQR